VVPEILVRHLGQALRDPARNPAPNSRSKRFFDRLKGTGWTGEDQASEMALRRRGVQLCRNERGEVLLLPRVWVAVWRNRVP